MAAVTPKILYQGQPGIADTELYKVPANKKATITAILAGNTDASTRWFTLNLVPSAGTASNNNVLGGKQKRLVGTSDSIGGDDYAFEIPFPMNVGDKVSGIQELATAITVQIFGIEEDA